MPTAYSAVVMPASLTSRVRRFVRDSQSETISAILRREDMGKGSLLEAANISPDTDLWTADAPVDKPTADRRRCVIGEISLAPQPVRWRHSAVTPCLRSGRPAALREYEAASRSNSSLSTCPDGLHCAKSECHGRQSNYRICLICRCAGSPPTSHRPRARGPETLNRHPEFRSDDRGGRSAGAF